MQSKETVRYWSETPCLRQPSVLVVDVDRGSRRAIRDELFREGFVVNTAASQRQGIELAESGEYDAIVCGLSRRDLDGLALARSLRHLRPPPSVLLLVHGPRSAALGDARTAGACEVLPMPLDLRQLSLTLREMTS